MSTLEVPASTFATPTIMANQVQLAFLPGQTLLEFRMILPDIHKIGSTEGNEKQMLVKAELETIPPIARILLPEEIALELKNMLERTLSKNA